MITAFSFLMSVFWFNVFIIPIALLRKRDGFITNFSIAPLLFGAVICIARLLCIFEFPKTIVIPSTRIFPAIIHFMTAPLFTFGTSISFCILNLLIGVWVVGSVCFIISYIKQSVWMYQYTHACQETADERLTVIIDEIVAKSGKHVKVKLVESSEIVIPMVVGYFNPTIFLPDIFLTNTELRNILSHEWTHFLHKDLWVKLCVHFISILFWWDPFIHILESNLNYILELRCDVKITSSMSMESKIKYLESIKKIIDYHAVIKKEMKHTETYSAVFFASARSPNQIEQRFNLILNSNTKKKYKLMIAFLYTATIAVFILSNMFVVQPQFTSPSDPNYETFSITTQNAYLVVNEDGSYALYADGKFRFSIDAAQIGETPYSSLPIKK